MNKLEIISKIEKVVYVTQPSPVILVSTIVGKVIDCDIDEDKYSENKITLRNNIPNIYHVTGNKFMINGKMKRV